MHVLPSVIAPRRLSFSSSRAEKNFSILSAYIWGARAEGAQQSLSDGHREAGASDGMLSAL